MSYRLVDSSSATFTTALPSGLEIPVPSLAEVADGSTYLIVGEETVPVSVWAAAKFAEIKGLIKVSRDANRPHRYASRDYFEEQALIDPQKALYTLPDFVWHDDLPPGFFDVQEPTEGREEPSQSFLVNLHTHSEFSALDGLSNIEEIVTRAVELGQKAVAITDHGNVSGHPDLQDVCEEAGIKPIFGMEAYLVDDRHDRSDAKQYEHITLWAMNDQGLNNLWSMSTEASRDGFHGHPRLDYETLKTFNEGVIAGTGCLRGPLAHPYLEGNPAKALRNLANLIDIFGDRLYVEMHCNKLEDQIKVNRWLVDIAAEFNLPMVAAVDSHYTYEHEKEDHQVWLAMQTGRDVSDESSLFGGGQDYHIADDNEVMESLLYLGEDVVIECVTNTGVIADRCSAKIRPREGMPLYSNGDDPEGQDIEKLFDLCQKRWVERTEGKRHTQDEYLARFEREMGLLVDKKFPGYFLMNADLTTHAKSNGVLVGPGRGSGAGSLVAYILGITEVDPVENELLFERFMTEGRTALPDFDIDYPSSRKAFMLEYAQRRWGKNHVCAVGTHTRIQNKGAFRDTARAIRSLLPDDHYADIDKISKLITAAEASTAGLGLSWDELHVAIGDELEPYKKKYPLLFRLAEKFRGRLKTYSRHAAGLVIDPNCDLEKSLPMSLSSDGSTLVTQLDKDVLEKLNYVKFDFLNLSNLDTIQDTIDLIAKNTGERIDVNKWRDEYNNQEVFDMLGQGWTLGVFQLETNLGTRTIKKMNPHSVADIADSTTIGRPGPMRSGMDKIFFARRNGEESVTFADKRLKDVLAKTHGVMLYQEDIMAICMVLANYDSNEADYVRKILGKKKKELVEEEGKKFVSRAVENGTDQAVADQLWAQMAEFALYSFNRAHAFSYATLAYWTAWFKYYYPGEFLTARLSQLSTSGDTDDIPLFVQEARRLGYQILPPDINDSAAGFSNKDRTIRYGFESLKGIGAAATEAIMQGQPYESFADFMERKGEKCNTGHIKILAHVGTFDSIFPNRKALEADLAEGDVKPSERCIFWRMERNEFNLPCGYDWSTEPAQFGRTGKPLKQKAPPKICSRACRRFTPRPLPSEDPFSPENSEPYTPEEIREIEMDTLGVYLSSTPFDSIHPDDLAELTTGDQLQICDTGAYLSAMVITDVRRHITKKGDTMLFVKGLTPSGYLDMSVFSNTIRKYSDELHVGNKGFISVSKDAYGVSLQAMETF